MTAPTMTHRLTAEFIGTFWLVSAVAALRSSQRTRPATIPSASATWVWHWPSA